VTKVHHFIRSDGTPSKIVAILDEALGHVLYYKDLSKRYRHLPKFYEAVAKLRHLNIVTVYKDEIGERCIALNNDLEKAKSTGPWLGNVMVHALADEDHAPTQRVQRGSHTYQMLVYLAENGASRYGTLVSDLNVCDNAINRAERWGLLQVYSRPEDQDRRLRWVAVTPKGLVMLDETNERSGAMNDWEQTFRGTEGTAPC
jgi:hypothetical protein